jgi:hypothetical protein
MAPGAVTADLVEREALLTHGEPFYVPPYDGSKAWAGIRLDHARTDWERVAEPTSGWAVDIGGAGRANWGS